MPASQSAISYVQRGGRVVGRGEALFINIAAAKALQDLISTNLGPHGTLKMLVAGDGSVRLTKDGAILIKQMHIKHPAASLIARAATAQDRITGDGTTTDILLIGELLRQCERFLAERQHPRVLVDGLAIARDRALHLLDQFATCAKAPGRELLIHVAQTSLRTKVTSVIADRLAEVCVDAVLTVYTEGEPIDLHMVERIAMHHRTAEETAFVAGLVLDHGPRHPRIPLRITNAYVLTCNVSLEFAKPVVNTTMAYKSGGEREAMVAGERSHIDARLEQIITFKERVCADGEDRSFLLVNEKGIDPPSLERLANAGIVALRRAKRRNMRRLARACGGRPVNSLDDLTPDVLGHAGLVYVQQLGDEKYTFVEQLANPKACTVLIKGPSRHVVQQVQDAIYDGLRAVRNTLEDKRVIAGAGAFEVWLHHQLNSWVGSVDGKYRLGVRVFADAVLAIPKALALNSGHDPQQVLLDLQAASSRDGVPLGLDLASGCPVSPADIGVWDNYSVKRFTLISATQIASQILQIDEILQIPQAQRSGPGGMQA